MGSEGNEHFSAVFNFPAMRSERSEISSARVLQKARKPSPTERLPCSL
jgi:hypothetical protein